MVLNQTAVDIIEHLKANPGASAFQLLRAFATAVPGFVATPMLYTLGLGKGGPFGGGTPAS